MVWLWIWGIVTSISLVVEFLTANLLTIWFAGGGLVTLLVVALVPDLGLLWQFVIFIGVSVGLLLSTRKLCFKLLNNDIKSIIGLKITVNNVQKNYTYHKINGIYRRVYAAEGEKWAIGDEIKIHTIKGSKLLAKKVKVKNINKKTL